MKNPRHLIAHHLVHALRAAETRRYKRGSRAIARDLGLSVAQVNSVRHLLRVKARRRAAKAQGAAAQGAAE